MIIIIADVDEVAALLDLDEARQPEIVRPQTSGPCVHYDEQTEHAADAYPCTYPYGDEHSDGVCPHLDNPDVLCPVKDACAAMHEVARMRDKCETEQEEQDADMAAQDAVYETETPAIADPGRLHTYVVEPEPEFPEPAPEEEPVYEASPLVGEMRLDARGWTPEEERALRGATTPAEAVALYRAAYPGSSRTDAAIKSRYHLKIRPQRGATPAPDFAGDAVPVTQCDEAAIRRPRFKTGDRVRISHPAFRGYTGTIRRYYAATANYLTHIDGTTDTMWLSEEYLEAL